MYDYQNIRLGGKLGQLTLKQISIQVKPNQHIKTHISCETLNNITFEELEELFKDNNLSIIDINKNETLFSGTIYQKTVDINERYYHIDIEAYSYSVLLDQEEKSRSFQDISMTHGDIISQVLEQAEARSESNVNNDTSIGIPIIQYKETDWEFIKRVASKINQSCYSKLTENCPAIITGMKTVNRTATFFETEYSTGIDSKYFEMGASLAGIQKTDYFYYQVISYDNYNIGDNVEFKGKSLIIYEKEIEMKAGELLFYYKLGTLESAKIPTKYNENMSGMALSGKVIETDKETVKIHLDIDENQETSTAYQYQWTPTSGNLMYCMPKVGTNVSLSIFDYDEASAKATDCVRTNGMTCSSMSDYNKRKFQTENEKYMEINPDSINLATDKDAPINLMMNDETGITLGSNKQLTIIADEGIHIESPQIMTNCFNEMNILQTGEDVSPESLNAPKASMVSAGNQDYFGKHTVVNCNGERETFEPFDDAPVEGEFDWWELAGNIAAGVAAICVVAIVIVATAGVGAALVCAAIGGAVSVGVLAYSDWKSGNVSDQRNYLVKGLSGAVSGAICGGFGPSLSYTFAKYLTQSMLIGAAGGAAGSLTGDIAEWGLGLDDFLEGETVSNFFLNMVVGGVAGGIAGGFSYTIASVTTPIVNKITNGTFDQAKRLSLDILKTKSVNLPNAINKLYANKAIKIPAGVVYPATTAREAVRLFKQVPIPVLEQSLSQYWNVLVTNGMRETITSTLVGNKIGESIMKGYKEIIDSDKSSSDILNKYLNEYAY